MFRLLRFVLFLLAISSACSAWAGELTRLRIDELAPRDRLEVRTAKYVLRLEIVDPGHGRGPGPVFPRRGRFRPGRAGFVLGATKGRHPEGLMVVQTRQLEVGKGIELAFGTMVPPRTAASPRRFKPSSSPRPSAQSHCVSDRRTPLRRADFHRRLRLRLLRDT